MTWELRREFEVYYRLSN